MQKILLITIGLIFSNLAYSQNQSFEIKQHINDFQRGKNTSYEAIWKINTDKALMEIDYMGVGEANLVILPKGNSIFLYSKSSENKVYQEVKTKEKNENISVFATNSTSIINGYNAVKYIMKSDTKEIEFWFTEDLDINFKMIANVFNNAEFIAIANNLPLKGFILSYTTKENGRIITQASFTSATETSFNPLVFEIPVGYSLYSEKK